MTLRSAPLDRLSAISHHRRCESGRTHILKIICVHCDSGLPFKISASYLHVGPSASPWQPTRHSAHILL
ncbi:hypothetical protein RSAG8_00300, partial [Rhizoctonia solani AG-8 WAC10335]